jgi:hypothetical protein
VFRTQSNVDGDDSAVFYSLNLIRKDIPIGTKENDNSKSAAGGDSSGKKKNSKWHFVMPDSSKPHHLVLTKVTIKNQKNLVGKISTKITHQSAGVTAEFASKPQLNHPGPMFWVPASNKFAVAFKYWITAAGYG